MTPIQEHRAAIQQQQMNLSQQSRLSQSQGTELKTRNGENGGLYFVRSRTEDNPDETPTDFSMLSVCQEHQRVSGGQPLCVNTAIQPTFQGDVPSQAELAMSASNVQLIRDRIREESRNHGSGPESTEHQGTMKS